MGTTAVVLLVVAALEAAGLVTITTLWLTGRRTRRRLRAQLAAARAANSPTAARRSRPRRLVPTPDEAVKAVFETVDRVREKGIGGAIRGSIDDLAGWAQVERPALVQLAGPDGTLAILFSDIEGSTELNERIGDREWVRLLARHDVSIRSAIERFGGQVVKTQGDGFMAAFPSAEAAVRTSIAVQRAFARGARDNRPVVRVRIGIHHGDVVHRDNDIFGRNVALAARVAAAADGQQVLVSDAVATAVADIDDLVLVGAHDVRLKGFAEPCRVSTVDWAA